MTTTTVVMPAATHQCGVILFHVNGFSFASGDEPLAFVNVELH